LAVAECGVLSAALLWRLLNALRLRSQDDADVGDQD
jgi:hypothetical protein